MKSQTKFKFTTESLNKFDSIFNYIGTLQEGVWLYENPFAEKHPLHYDKKNFIVQVGGGYVNFINGFVPDGMTFDEIVSRLKFQILEPVNQ